MPPVMVKAINRIRELWHDANDGNIDETLAEAYELNEAGKLDASDQRIIESLVMLWTMAFPGETVPTTARAARARRSIA